MYHRLSVIGLEYGISRNKHIGAGSIPPKQSDYSAIRYSPTQR